MTLEWKLSLNKDEEMFNFEKKFKTKYLNKLHNMCICETI